MSHRTLDPRPAKLAPVLGAAALIAACAVYGSAARAQSKPEEPARPWASPTPRPAPPVPGAPVPGAPVPGSPPQTSTPPPPTDTPIIARVEGRPITQRDYDRLAVPYFGRLQEQLGDAFKDELRTHAEYNVLNELIRRELMALEAKKLNLEVTEADTDAILATDPFFNTNGKFDPAKLEQFKRSPQSNYLSILPRIREVAATEKYEQQLLKRLSPPTKVVREEWSNRKEQVRFSFLAFTTRDVSLEPEASADEQLAFYREHPDQFERKARANVRYVRFTLPAEGDSLRSAEEGRWMERARSLADSLRDGTAIDSIAASLGGAAETGWFDLPPTAIPGLGRPQALIEALAAAEHDTSVRVVGPAVTPLAVVVGVIAAREPRRLPPYAEVRADVKRRADVEKQRVALEADKLAWYEAHQSELRSARARVTRILADPEIVSTKSLTRLSRDLARGKKDAAALARSAKARLDTLTLVKDAAPDSLFPATLVDSILAGRLATGTFIGPRRLGVWEVFWRTDHVDTAFTPSFEAARSQVERGFNEARRAKDEDEARVYFDAHRADYVTKPKYVLDYVRVPIPPIDSVAVSEDEIRRFYEAHTEDRYRQEAEVHARHILVSTRSGLSEVAARARADSIRAAIVAGADFAELAKSRSDDPGSATQGGDLGFFPVGRMVKEFSDTSFALPVGGLSQPVKTSFGFHVIRVEARKEAGVRPLDEIRVEIRAELANARGDSLARETAESIRTRIPKVGAAVAATSAGGVKTSTPVAATEPIPGVGSVPELGKDLENLTVGQWAKQPYREATSWLLVRVAERVPPGPAEFPEVRRQAVEDMKTAKKRTVIAERTSVVRAQLAAGASMDSAAAIYGGLKDSGLLTRKSGFVPYLGAEPRVVERAFGMKTGETSDTLNIANGTTWIRVEERKTLDGATFEADRAEISRELLAKNMEDWLDRKKKTARIEVLREDLKGPPPSRFKTVTTTIGG